MNIVYLCMLVQCALVAAAEKVQLVPPVPPTATPQAKIQTTPVSTVITDEIKEDEETASLRTLLALDEKEAAEGDARAAEEVALAREKIIEESALELSVPQQKEEKKTVLQPWKAHDQELLEFEFDNADLTTFITYIEKHFGIQFITDEALNPPSPQAKKLTGTKITFRTHQPLTKKEVWDLFLAFLDIAGVAPQVGPSERIIKLSSTDPRSPASVYRGPIPTYIGTDPALLPDNDMRIRYIYFVENTSLDVMKGVIDTWKGGTSPALVIFPDLKAIVMTDKAVNIKQNLEILKELDRVNQPEAMVVLRLRKMDASKAAELYKSLSRDEGSAGTLSTRLLGGKKPQTAAYFEEGTRVAVDPRTNSLFLFGSRGALKKIEHFIRKLDEGKERPYSPLYVYKLKYVAAETIANILKEAVQFQTESEAAKYGGVRDGDKYFKALSVTPEKSGNRLIINAEYEDYLKIYKLLEDIDIEQPQAAIKVLVLDVEIADDRELGVQMRRKIPGIEGLVGPNVTYQNSGLAGNSTTVVENPNGSGATRLLGDLVNLALSTTNPGSTFITLGADAFGVWGLLQILQTYQKISLVANPFIVVQHKYPAVVGSGTTRRILTGTALTATGSVNSFDDLTARLEVYVEPQISYEGYVTLNVRVTLEAFTDDNNQASGNRTTREVKTSVLLQNNETLALGGITRDLISEKENKWPILGDIPLIGWLFKNKQKIVSKSTLLVLITPEIIPSKDQVVANNFSGLRLNEVRGMISSSNNTEQFKDPIHRWFFDDTTYQATQLLDEYVERQRRYLDAEEEEREALKEGTIQDTMPQTGKARKRKALIEHVEQAAAGVSP